MKNTPQSLKCPDYPDDYDSDNPWESDGSGQFQNLAETLESYFTHGGTHTGVIALDAPWGCGKSLFFKMWRDALKKKGVQSVYFNAWENDFSNQPIHAFMQAIALEAKDETNEKKRKIIEQLLRTANDLCLHFPVLVGEVFESHWLLNIIGKIWGRTLVIWEKNRENSKNSSHQEGTKDALSHYAEQNEHREHFKKTLKEFAVACKAPSDEEYSKLPLFIMVDELDRCKPSFAIRLLEDIKHLFAVEGIVFVLAIHKEQLARSVGHTYGTNPDESNVYLDKFIDVTFPLPKILPEYYFRRILLPQFKDEAGIAHYGEFLGYLLSDADLPIGYRALTHVTTHLSFVDIPLKIQDTSNRQKPAESYKEGEYLIDFLASALILFHMGVGRTFEEAIADIQNLAERVFLKFCNERRLALLKIFITDGNLHIWTKNLEEDPTNQLVSRVKTYLRTEFTSIAQFKQQGANLLTRLDNNDDTPSLMVELLGGLPHDLGGFAQNPLEWEFSGNMLVGLIKSRIALFIISDKLKVDDKERVFEEWIPGEFATIYGHGLSRDPNGQSWKDSLERNIASLPSINLIS